MKIKLSIPLHTIHVTRYNYLYKWILIGSIVRLNVTSIYACFFFFKCSVRSILQRFSLIYIESTYFLCYIYVVWFDVCITKNAHNIQKAKMESKGSGQSVRRQLKAQMNFKRAKLKLNL